MRKRLLSIGIVVLALMLSTLFIVGFSPSDGDYDVMKKAVYGDTSKKAALLNSAAYDSGKAYISREGGKLYHYVVASLEAPPVGMFYEGWLLNSSGDKMSTGKLTELSDGNYELAFMSDMAMEDYNTVVITMEEVMDDMPETKVLSGIVEFVPGKMVPIDGEYYYFTGAPVGDATDIPGHAWIVTGDNTYLGAHFNSGPADASKWWSSDAEDDELLYIVEAIADEWSMEKAEMYADMGFIHYHEMASVEDGTLHPTKVVWLKHIAQTSFTLDGGPHPEFSHAVTPGVDLEFIPNGSMPYSP